MISQGLQLIKNEPFIILYAPRRDTGRIGICFSKKPIKIMEIQTGTILKETENMSTYKVLILSKDKKKYYYIWQVEKVLFEGALKNCWMTTSVSPPNYLGEVI